VRKIVELQLKLVQKMLENSNIELTATKKAVDYIAKIGFDPQFGARPIKRVIQKKLENELSKMILEEKVNKNSVIVVDEKNGKLVFSNK
jgi:ATP-dependent Clp protease ATP-binding subunit ClpB